MLHEGKIFELSGGAKVHIRQPTLPTDLNRLVEFLSGLPPKERNCLRYNVASKETCRARLEQLDGRHHFRLIAEMGDKIVGDITLDRLPFVFATHIAEVRGIIADDNYKRELGTVLFREILPFAEEAGIERLLAAVLPNHARLIATLEECGFIHEATLQGFARDIQSNQHNLLLFTKDLQGVWDRLAELIEDLDIRVPQ